MDWTKGYSAQYYMTVVDPITWRDTERIEITGGSIKHESTGLIESADVDCVNYDQSREKWIRIYLDARQNSGGERVALFTGLDSTPEAEYNGALQNNQVQCYSVLKPAETVYLDLGWYAPVGFDGAQLVKQLLSVTPAPVVVEGVAPALKESIVAEQDESNLTMAEKILKAIDWRYRIAGDGTITLCPKAKQPVIRFDLLNYDIVETAIKKSNDWYECPNVFRAIEDDMMAIARDDDPDSMLSVPTRGREIWAQETNCDLNENETIAEYAYRRLKEEQAHSISVEYERRFVPDVFTGDIVDLYLPQQNVNGWHKIESQTIDLGKSHVSEKVIEWQA